MYNRYSEPAPDKGVQAAEKGVKEEKCTTNTDAVDQELKGLRQEKQQLMQKLRLSINPGEARELERQLQNIERQLTEKDNDAYRRQHAAVYIVQQGKI